MGNLKELSAARMLAITEAWLDPARDRPKFNALSSGTVLLDIIQTAHDGVRATHDTPVSRDVAVVLDKQGRVDRRHDRKIRAVFFLLSGLAEASDDPNEVAALHTARDELLPNGLSATKDSYADEASNVELAAKRVSPASKGLLKKLALPRGSAWSIVEAWFAAGRELGTLEQQKNRLEASTTTGSPDESLRARNTWIRVVKHVESTLALENVRDDIASALLREVRLAERESALQSPDDADDEPRLSR